MINFLHSPLIDIALLSFAEFVAKQPDKSFPVTIEDEHGDIRQGQFYINENGLELKLFGDDSDKIITEDQMFYTEAAGYDFLEFHWVKGNDSFKYIIKPNIKQNEFYDSFLKYEQ